MCDINGTLAELESELRCLCEAFGDAADLVAAVRSTLDAPVFTLVGNVPASTFIGTSAWAGPLAGYSGGEQATVEP